MTKKQLSGGWKFWPIFSLGMSREWILVALCHQVFTSWPSYPLQLHSQIPWQPYGKKVPYTLFYMLTSLPNVNYVTNTINDTQSKNLINTIVHKLCHNEHVLPLKYVTQCSILTITYSRYCKDGAHNKSNVMWGNKGTSWHHIICPKHCLSCCRSETDYYGIQHIQMSIVGL